MLNGRPIMPHDIETEDEIIPVETPAAPEPKRIEVEIERPRRIERRRFDVREQRNRPLTR